MAKKSKAESVLEGRLEELKEDESTARNMAETLSAQRRMVEELLNQLKAKTAAPKRPKVSAVRHKVIDRVIDKVNAEADLCRDHDLLLEYAFK